MTSEPDCTHVFESRKASCGIHRGRRAVIPSPSRGEGITKIRIAFLSAAPQLLRRAAGAFRHRFKLRPADRGMADARADAAIGAGEHVLAPDELRIAHEA